jgi:hypothetical protein
MQRGRDTNIDNTRLIPAFLPQLCNTWLLQISFHSFCVLWIKGRLQSYISAPNPESRSLLDHAPVVIPDMRRVQQDRLPMLEVARGMVLVAPVEARMKCWPITTALKCSNPAPKHNFSRSTDSTISRLFILLRDMFIQCEYARNHSALSWNRSHRKQV